ncbi:MAG: hypothetical protein ACOZNI_03610 [Myxococcota bacterium]
MSVAVHADLSIRTPAFVVQDDAGEPLARHLALPPVGAGVDVTTDDRLPNALSFTLGFHVTAGAWDTAVAWAPTTWTVVADAGWRHWYAGSGRAEGFYSDLGAGLRLVRLAQPWWTDHVATGVGEHLGVGYALRSGWTVEARGETCFSLYEVGGELDSAAQDLTWTWRPSSARLAARVGRVFR